ncbi:zinc metalloprotease HtpX [Candidatus Nanosalina sp. VS9-1]|uniref:zinc metalloprotease HtpX n=1 Tax=Candidatus Nanosalina sp. VS9-1 TaxID=3388566 RepID=UPI0039E01D7D
MIGQNLKTNFRIFTLLSVLTGLFIGAGYIIGGRGGMILGLFFAGIMNFASYWYSDKIVLKMYGAEKISEEENPDLHKMVERLAEDAGIPKPKVYMNDMEVPNAFATGRNPEKGVVCVTKGLMNTLNDEEIEGVIAHELAHIKNRDTLINAVVATIAGAVGILAEMAFWGAMFGGREEESDMISALVLMILTPLIATIIRMAVSRSMEFRADRDAVKISGNRKGLSSALEKISEASSRPLKGHASRSQEAGANLFISNPFSGDKITKYFSTHPPLDERLENIESTEL